MHSVVRMVIASLDSLIRSTGACGSGRWPGGYASELTDIWYGSPRNLVEAWGRTPSTLVYLVKSMPTCMLFPYGLQ